MNTTLLRQCRLEIYSPIRIKNEFGEWDEEWQLKTTCRAGLLSQSMNKNITEDEYFHPMYKEFIVRSYVDIEPIDRIKYEEKFYNVTSVDKNKYYNDKQIKCELVKE